MESVMNNMDVPGWFTSFAGLRADAYVLAASLLGKPPSEHLVGILRNLEWDEGVPEKVCHALRVLRQACLDYPLALLEEEYHSLFVGLGSGEVVPYASWYREGKIQSTPLAALRSDLVRLGIVKQEETIEPEDHAGALCEIMALISQEPNNVPHTTQARFFEQHIAPWMIRFFDDLNSIRSSAFYRAVGLFGSCFLEFEREYLEYCANKGVPFIKGGLEG
jgi:TorA maturation chaperone TorD